MSSYLEKLRARKRLSGEVPKPPEGENPAEEPTEGTVKTAKTPFGSNGSDPGRRFAEIAHLPSWCRADCRHLRRVALHKLPLLLACERAESPTKWIWSRLDRMSSCPLTTRLEPTPSSPPPPPPPPPTTGPEVTGPVNLGNPGEFTIRQLAELVIELTGSVSKLVFKPLPADDPLQRQPDIRLAREALGWEPTVPLREGLGHTIAYFDQLLSQG